MDQAELDDMIMNVLSASPAPGWRVALSVHMARMVDATEVPTTALREIEQRLAALAAQDIVGFVPRDGEIHYFRKGLLDTMAAVSK